MRKLAVFSVLIVVILVAGCVGQQGTAANPGNNATANNTNATVPPSTGFCGTSTRAACSSDADCVRGGCSSQVCYGKSEPPSATTCEWTECYDAQKYNMTCGCVGGKCAWSK
jgi:eight-cysteine-cluster-containing protein